MPGEHPCHPWRVRLMAIIRKPMRSKHFTQIPNHWSRDRRLSLKALGALTYIVGHAADYPLTIAQMIAEFPDGKHAVKTAIKELEGLGYLKRQQVRRDGKFAEYDFEIDEFPEPSTGDRFSGDGKTGDGKNGAGGSATKNTTPRTPSAEVQDSKETHSLSTGASKDVWAKTKDAKVPNQRRESADTSKDQKFKSGKHRLLAKYGWTNENDAGYLIGEIEERYEPYSDGWWFSADSNGSLVDRIQEVLDDVNASRGTSFVADKRTQNA